MNKLTFTLAIIICAVAAATAQNRTMYKTYLANADSFYLAGDYTKAYSFYTALWDKETFPDNDPTCKEIFLADIADLEAAGIHHKDFEKVRVLLK